MAAPELPELPDGLPWWVYYWRQVFGGAIFIAGVIGLAIKEWTKGKNEEQSSHAILEQAELADMSAVRNLKPVLENIPAVVESVADKIDALVPKIDMNGSKLDTILVFMDFERAAQRDLRTHLEHEISDLKARVEKIDRNIELDQRERDRRRDR